MPYPPRTIRPTVLNVSIPEDTRAKLDLYLYSESEGRIPKGAYSKFLSALIENYFRPQEQSHVPPQR